MIAEVLMRLPLAQRVTNDEAEERSAQPLKELCVIGSDVQRMRDVLGLVEGRREITILFHRRDRPIQVTSS